VLFLHETHQVVGAREDEFEAAYREGWMPTLANQDNARLLWYTNHAHGSGMSYNVVTITGIVDGTAWEGLVRRAQSGDLKPWMRELDNLRHEVDGQAAAAGRLVTAAVRGPGDGAHRRGDPSAEPVHGGHRLAVLRRWDDYIRSWDEIYYRPMSKAPARMRILDIQACFQVAHGSYQRREAMLWQKIEDSNDYAALVHLLTNDIAPEHRGPGRLHVRGPEVPRSMAKPTAADVGLVTALLIQDSCRLPTGVVLDA